MEEALAESFVEVRPEDGIPVSGASCWVPGCEQVSRFLQRVVDCRE